MTSTIKPAIAAEATHSETAAEIWGVPAVTAFGYPLIQAVGTDADNEPWYAGSPDADGTRYGVSGAGDEWRVVFAEDNYLVREGTAALLATVPMLLSSCGGGHVVTDNAVADVFLKPLEGLMGRGTLSLGERIDGQACWRSRAFTKSSSIRPMAADWWHGWSACRSGSSRSTSPPTARGWRSPGNACGFLVTSTTPWPTH